MNVKCNLKSDPGATLHDERYWTLLHNVISTSSTSSRWLSSLIIRSPISTIAAKSLTLGSRLPSTAYQCLSVMWPLATPKLGLDKLYDVFIAILSLSDPTDQHCTAFIKKAFTSVREALETASTLKRVRTSEASHIAVSSLTSVKVGASSILGSQSHAMA